MLHITSIINFSVEKNGDVCISILHEPGDDKWGYEKASERWLPVHTVETILISVISMLADPNDESPANVDAAVSQVIALTIPTFACKSQGMACVQQIFKIHNAFSVQYFCAGESLSMAYLAQILK